MHRRPRAIPAILLATFLIAFLAGRAAAPFDGEGVEPGTETRAVETVPTLRLPASD